MLARFKDTRGFTLIELLVVIGIMGILAAALVSLVDPVEQLNKARDNALKVKTKTLLQALTSYYATNSQYPWEVSATDACVSPATITVLVASGGTPTDAWFNATDGCFKILEDAGELKATYRASVTGDDGKKLFLRSAATGTTVVMCYDPLSKSANISAETIYNSGCEGTTGATTDIEQDGAVAACDTSAERQAAVAGTCFQRQKI